MKNKPKILFEDDELVVVNKPPGILSIPDRYRPEKFNLKAHLGQKRSDVRVVHRLDKNTSGVICFAKTETAHKALSLQFEARTAEKKYLALVEGIVYRAEGIVDSPIATDSHKQGRMIISSKGKASHTEYRILEAFKHYSLLEVVIKTGRTHQIRVHLASIGHPLAADALYGNRDAVFLSQIKGRKYRRGKNQEEKPLISRTCLHAGYLAIVHPGSGQKINFEAPLPKDFQAMLSQLRKWGAVFLYLQLFFSTF